MEKVISSILFKDLLVFASLAILWHQITLISQIWNGKSIIKLQFKADKIDWLNHAMHTL